MTIKSRECKLAFIFNCGNNIIFLKERCAVELIFTEEVLFEISKNKSLSKITHYMAVKDCFRYSVDMDSLEMLYYSNYIVINS